MCTQDIIFHILSFWNLEQFFRTLGVALFILSTRFCCVDPLSLGRSTQGIIFHILSFWLFRWFSQAHGNALFSIGSLYHIFLS
ncbi:hypothetical protein RHGRI_018624 [Rhododendron griersonianum]|uniref:Uncharacterized protein n=1 Tax=Rhododendron griersonianum TaxID=479676 RepID=A0AAV6K294_9ERIC|nr:hypothetical protein RHGRI_018624 [Rhododendron griersonianum]